MQRPRIEEIDHIEVECSEVWKRREEWSQAGDIIGTPTYRDFLDVREDFLRGRLIVRRVLQLDAMKKVYAGADVEQSTDKRTGEERVFVIPEVINDFVDEFRWDIRLYCVSAGF